MTPLQLHADRTLIRTTGSSVRYLLASIDAPPAPPREHRLPVNIAFVLDRSGSMQGDAKFPLAVEAVRQALALLTDIDRFSLVVFDDRVDVIARSTFATPDAKRAALRALEQVEPRQSTDLCAGWMRGCEQLSEFIAPGTVTRALLLTDGQANSGETDHDTLARHAAELRRRGITTSAFGVGADFDERLLGDITREGGGNFYFVRTAEQIPDLVTSELGEALEVVLPNATLTVTVPPGATARLMHSFRSTRTPHLTIELGDLVSAQQLELVIRVECPAGTIGDTVRVTAALGNEAHASHDFTFASHEANDAEPRNRRVDRAVAKIYAARARAEATEANRQHEFDHARDILQATSRRIMRYAGDDTKLLAIADALVSEIRTYAERPMSPRALKESHYLAETALHFRDDEGKAMRG